MKITLTILLTFWLICGCAVGPDYQRPGYPTPATFRGEGTGIPTQPVEASFGDLKWFEVFKDPQLQELIGIALKENYDVQIAAQRVLAAREQVTIQRSYLFPTLERRRRRWRASAPRSGVFSMCCLRLERTAGVIYRRPLLGN